MVEDDWQYIAIIIDRVLLIAYTFGKIKFESLQQGIHGPYACRWLFPVRKSVFKNLEFPCAIFKLILAGLLGSFVIFQRVWYSKVWDGDPCLPPELLSNSASSGNFSVFSLLIWTIIMFFVQ